MKQRKLRLSGVLFVIVMVIYVGNVLGILFTVILDSISKDWFTGPLPPRLTFEWYGYAAQQHNIPQLLIVTFVVAIGVTLISLLVAFPAAYALGRHDFKGKGLLLSFFLLPMIVPPMAFGIPLAMVFYKFRLATRVIGVVLANLVPIIPFMILILMPFIEQVSANLESAARMLGAKRLTVFLRILVPLTLPGILTGGILSIVNTISQFPLTYLVSGAGSQTIVVALYTDAMAAGSRPMQAVDGMAVIYFLITMTCLVIALRFVSPTQMVFKIK